MNWSVAMSAMRCSEAAMEGEDALRVRDDTDAALLPRPVEGESRVRDEGERGARLEEDDRLDEGDVGRRFGESVDARLEGEGEGGRCLGEGLLGDRALSCGKRKLEVVGNSAGTAPGGRQGATSPGSD